MEDTPERGHLEHHAEVRSTGPGDQERVLSPQWRGDHLLGGFIHALELPHFQCPVAYNSGDFLVIPNDIVSFVLNHTLLYITSSTLG